MRPQIKAAFQFEHLTQESFVTRVAASRLFPEMFWRPPMTLPSSLSSSSYVVVIKCVVFKNKIERKWMSSNNSSSKSNNNNSSSKSNNNNSKSNNNNNWFVWDPRFKVKVIIVVILIIIILGIVEWKKLLILLSLSLSLSLSLESTNISERYQSLPGEEGSLHKFNVGARGIFPFLSLSFSLSQSLWDLNYLTCVVTKYLLHELWNFLFT